MCAVLQLRQSYEYDAKDRAAVVTDTRDGSTIRNIYDLTDRPTESEQRDGDGNLKYRTLISYDIKNRVKSFTEATATETKKTEYTYDGDDRVTEVKYNGSDSSIMGLVESQGVLSIGEFGGNAFERIQCYTGDT